MDKLSLIFTILSFIVAFFSLLVACISLWKMSNIDKNTSKLTKEYWNKINKELKDFHHDVNNNASKNTDNTIKRSMNSSKLQLNQDKLIQDENEKITNIIKTILDDNNKE